MTENKLEALPHGSYIHSSRNACVERDEDSTLRLFAERKCRDGSWVESLLVLKEVHTTDGRLEYGLDMNVREV